MRHDDDDEKSVRVAVAVSRAVALSEELQATVLELAATLRSSGALTDADLPPPGEAQE